MIQHQRRVGRVSAFSERNPQGRLSAEQNYCAVPVRSLEIICSARQSDGILRVRSKDPGYSKVVGLEGTKCVRSEEVSESTSFLSDEMLLVKNAEGSCK